MRKRGAQCCLLLALVLCGASVGRAQVNFTDLGNVPGASTAGSGVTAINSSGQFVGYFLNSAGHYQGFLFSGGSFLTIVPGTNTSNITINDSGQIAGSFYNSANEHGFLFSGGTYTTIDVPGARDTYVTAINNSGQIAGYIVDSNGNYHDFLLSGGTFTTFDPPGSNLQSTSVTAMNDSGQMVGYFEDASFHDHGFLFSGGIITTIDAPGSTGSFGTEPIAINDSGQIAGSFTDSVSEHGFLLAGGTFTTINPPIANDHAGVTGMNASGQVVGDYNTPTGENHGFLFSRGTFTTIDPPGATTTIVYAINRTGQMLGIFYTPLISTFTATEHIFLASSPVTLLDPVPNLLNGPAVTTDSGLLSQPFLAPVVSGVSADGITQVVVKIAAPAAGEQYTLTLMNDGNSQSNLPDEDGALGNLGTSTFVQSQTAVTAQDTVNGPMAFAIYRAPVDFTRPLNTNDKTAAKRSVSIQVLDGGTGTMTTVPVQIIRPPVALIHGLWSDKSTWEEFADSLDSNNLFDIYRVNYQSSNFVQVQINERIALTQLGDFLEQFKLAQGVAAVQFDIVGHSMGGLISRYMVLDPRFNMDGNYQKGWIHKLITIDTPHAGSIIPKLLDQSGPVCHNVFANVGMAIDGATHDLEPDSLLLQTLYSLPLPPTHAIAGHMTITQDVAASLLVNDAVALTNGAPVLVCPTLFLHVVPFSFGVLYGEPNDIAVSQSSQVYGFSPGVSADVVSGVVHLHVAPFPWLVQWAGVPPGALDRASGNPDLVLNLLNTPPSNGAFLRGTQ